MKTATVEQPTLPPVTDEMERAAEVVNQRTLAVRGGDPFLALIEKVVSDPAADVSKLEKLLDMQIRVRAMNAEAAFNIAMSDAQAEMRPVAADATNPQTHSRYASYEALDRALRPIYTKYGFALSFNTGESPLTEHVRVLCDVTHKEGHAKLYKIDMPADGKGAKGGDVMTKTHASGSAVSYGMRYLLKMIFNVAVGEDDDDGNRAGSRSSAPAGYSEWLESMEDVAVEGLARLQVEFQRSAKPFKEHATTKDITRWRHIKAKAEKASKAVQS